MVNLFIELFILHPNYYLSPLKCIKSLYYSHWGVEKTRVSSTVTGTDPEQDLRGDPGKEKPLEYVGKSWTKLLGNYGKYGKWENVVVVEESGEMIRKY